MCKLYFPCLSHIKLAYRLQHIKFISHSKPYKAGYYYLPKKKEKMRKSNREWNQIRVREWEWEREREFKRGRGSGRYIYIYI